MSNREETLHLLNRIQSLVTQNSLLQKEPTLRLTLILLQDDLLPAIESIKHAVSEEGLLFPLDEVYATLLRLSRGLGEVVTEVFERYCPGVSLHSLCLPWRIETADSFEAAVEIFQKFRDGGYVISVKAILALMKRCDNMVLYRVLLEEVLPKAVGPDWANLFEIVGLREGGFETLQGLWGRLNEACGELIPTLCYVSFIRAAGNSKAERAFATAQLIYSAALSEGTHRNHPALHTSMIACCGSHSKHDVARSILRKVLKTKPVSFLVKKEQ